MQRLTPVIGLLGRPSGCRHRRRGPIDSGNNDLLAADTHDLSFAGGGRLMRVRTRDSGWGKYRARIANWAADGLARREHLPAPYGHRPSLPCGRTLIIGSSHRLPLPILGASY